jgi:NAD(P)-dependent dehydrogenase (short-subunit alcohol dehydrogenase family)
MTDSPENASTDADRASSPAGAPLASLWTRGRRPRLLPLAEQVVVITGASSGIGRVTARMAAARGAAVVLAARDGAALDEVVAGIVADGGRATAVVADVGDPVDVARIAAAALTEHHRFDTWINDAGISTACPSRTCAGSWTPTSGASCTDRSRPSRTCARARATAGRS